MDIASDIARSFFVTDNSLIVKYFHLSATLLEPEAWSYFAGKAVSPGLPFNFIDCGIL